MKFSELVEKLGAPSSSLSSRADLNPNVAGVAAIEGATATALSYIEGEKFAAQVETTAAAALILPMDAALQEKAIARNIAWISTPHPRLLFAKAIAQFYQPFRPAPGIHPTAVVDPSARLGEEVSIGAHVVIQAGASIGNQVCIHPNVVVYPHATIGDRTTLHANSVVHERAQIGADCVIHCGAVIGSEGFGFVPIPEGWLKMEQSGLVVLEDGVEIGCNSAVDRPAVGETRIGCNTKIDNLVQIGHGSQIGKNCALAAQVGLAGGAQLGERVILGGQVGVANQAKVGNGVQAGAQAGIHSTVAAGTAVLGTPAIPYNLYLKASAVFNRLPEMHKTLRQIQRQLQGK
ncbi:UDP-3-O-(3-hydroxymyristoyl)glucosamine N-acyltransferase [Phormidium tenue FACHB-886]|nr:UDP-3-O-(3-hydroxymyristoyl)glucosamine N-acyltransferase [Phormidium tenue FACHB-886]